MAYKNISGIVVKIGGDTSGLQAALKSLYAQTSSLQKELRGINSLLKLDPKNTELLSQKQTVLKQNIAATTKTLEGLKQAQSEFIASGGKLDSSEYRKLQREILKTEEDLKRLKLEASNWTQASSKLSELGTKFKEVGDKVTSVAKSFSIVSAGIAGVIGSGLKYNATIEQSTKAFETFLGSAEAAEKAVNAIKKQSVSSPFNTQDLIKANQMLVTTGVNADDSRKTISALADAIALTGGGNDELTRMASNLQQIKNAGKATSMDIRQFAYAGIDVYGILAETTGKNVEELKKMDITYDQLSAALQKASSEGGKYYQGQEKMTDTLNGAVSKLKKTFQEFTGELAESLVPTVKKLTSSLQGLLEKFKNLSPEQKEMITKIGLIVAAIGPALIVVGKLITAMGTIFTVGGKIAGIIAKLTTGMGSLSGVLTILTGPVGIVLGILTGLAAIFVALWNNSETFRNSMTALGERFSAIFNEQIQPAIEGIKEAFGTLWNDLLVPLATWLGDTFGPVFETVFGVIGSAVETAFGVMALSVQTISGVFQGLVTFISGVFATDWEKAWQGLSDIFGTIFDGLKGLLITPLNWIIDKINNFIWHVNQIKIPEGVPGVGGIGFDFPYLSTIQLAKGGVVTQPTYSLIGEGKSAEAVIPLDRTLTRYMAEAMREAGGTGTINVNFYPQKMSDAELDNAFNYVNRRFGLAY